MRGSRTRWRLVAVMVSLFVAFAAGYFVGRDLTPPTIQESVVKDIQVHFYPVSREEMNEHDRQQHEEMMERSTKEYAKLREEREQWAADKKLLQEVQEDLDNLFSSDRVISYVEAEIKRRVAQQLALQKDQTDSR